MRDRKRCPLLRWSLPSLPPEGFAPEMHLKSTPSNRYKSILKYSQNPCPHQSGCTSAVTKQRHEPYLEDLVARLEQAGGWSVRLNPSNKDTL